MKFHPIDLIPLLLLYHADNKWTKTIGSHPFHFKAEHESIEGSLVKRKAYSKNCIQDLLHPVVNILF